MEQTQSHYMKTLQTIESAEIRVRISEFRGEEYVTTYLGRATCEGTKQSLLMDRIALEILISKELEITRKEEKQRRKRQQQFRNLMKNQSWFQSGFQTANQNPFRVNYN